MKTSYKEGGVVNNKGPLKQGGKEALSQHITMYTTHHLQRYFKGSNLLNFEKQVFGAVYEDYHCGCFKGLMFSFRLELKERR